ncbi:hypothetical protein ACET3Z_028517 [Daucus carota]
MPCNPEVGSDIYLKYIIFSKIWRNCASGQTASRIGAFHSRKFLINFPELGVGSLAHFLHCIADKMFLQEPSETILWGPKFESA